MSLSKQQEVAREIREQGGFMTDKQAEILTPAHPRMQVLVRWQDGREPVALANLKCVINHEEGKGKVLRDVSLLAHLSESFYKFYGVTL